MTKTTTYEIDLIGRLWSGARGRARYSLDSKKHSIPDGLTGPALHFSLKDRLKRVAGDFESIDDYEATRHVGLFESLPDGYREEHHFTVVRDWETLPSPDDWGEVE